MALYPGVARMSMLCEPLGSGAALWGDYNSSLEGDKSFKKHLGCVPSVPQSQALLSSQAKVMVSGCFSWVSPRSWSQAAPQWSSQGHGLRLFLNSQAKVMVSDCSSIVKPRSWCQAAPQWSSQGHGLRLFLSGQAKVMVSGCSSVVNSSSAS